MSEITVSTFWRTSYPVKAVQLTEGNIRQIAEEIGAEYWEEPDTFGLDKTTPVPNIVYGKSRAFIGDYAAMHPDGGGATFYARETFLGKFHTHSERMAKDERYAKIYAHIVSAMNKQASATWNGDSNGDMDIVAIETTKSILGEL